MTTSFHAAVVIGGWAILGCGARSDPGAGLQEAGLADSISLAPDASLVVTDADSPEVSATNDATCGDPSVTGIEPNDAASLPLGSCVAPAAPSCMSVPRVTLSCPIVRGPGDSSVIAPGDTITVSLLLTNTVFLAYPCFGLTADHGVPPSPPAVTIYALKPTQDEPLVFKTQLPQSLARGTVIHFVAYVVLSPCPGDTGALEFDVTVP